MQPMAVRPKSCYLNVSKGGEESTSSYISAFHPASPERSLTRPGWTRRTRCVHPTERRQRNSERREREQETRWAFYFTFAVAVLSWTPCCSFMMSLLYSPENGARRLLQVSCYFLPCTWLSPEAEICHLWSLVRWMLLAPSLKVAAHKHTVYCIFETKLLHFFSSMIPHCEWAWQINLSNKVENNPLWHFCPLSFVRVPCTESNHRGSKFPINLPKLWPSAVCCETTLCAAERNIC